MRPERGAGDGGVAAFVAREECALVEDVSLQPDLGGEARADGERLATQRAPVDEDFELEAFEV